MRNVTTPPAASDRLRILVASSVHPSGDPRVTLRTAGVLARRHAVTLATQTPDPAVSGVDFHPLSGGRLRRIADIWRTARRGGFDVVSLHDPELIPIGIALRLLFRQRIVFDLHEDLPAQLLTKPWLAPPLRPVLSALSRVVLRVAERCLEVTLAEEGYRRLFRAEHPVLANFPLVESLPPPAPSSGFIVYVGDVTEARGATTTVRAVAGMERRLPVVFVGRTPGTIRDELLRVAEETGVDVDLRGFLPNREALEVAARGVVGVCPLHDEPNHRQSLPTKVIEYLAVGLPVVASDLPGTSRVVGDSPHVLLVAPGDVEALRSALSRAVLDPTLRAGAAAGAEAVRRRFTWPAEQLLALYERPPGRRRR